MICLYPILNITYASKLCINQYFYWLNWNDIAAKLFCSYATVRRWNNKELSMLLTKEQIKD
jgi:hypothetical protein